MDLLILFILAVAMIGLLASVIVFNFYRFRFKGDSTVVFLVIFVVLLAANTVFTLALLDYTALTTEFTL